MSGAVELGPSHRLVRRRRLLERLSNVPGGGVALVSAQPGSGKTQLLRSWLEDEQLGDRVAWVSVECGEPDGQRFWLAVIDELARATGEDPVVDQISPAPGFRGEAVVARLRAQLEALDGPVVLVIDDLQDVLCADGLRWLALFLQELPAPLRVALATRVEPRLGLHRLRVAGRLTEIRSPDLRFSVEETHELLDEAGIELSGAAVALLHERTEGWAAGLRLAVISLTRHPEPERWVRELSGSERTIADYLLAEVLDHQPPEVRNLLVRTSILDRVNGALADVLTGGSGSERILQSLEDANAFITAVDAGRSWFRYQHLFADLLRLELRRTAPTMIDTLHRLAARWYEEQGSVVEAIRHAQAARDWPHATRLLAEHNFDLILDGRAATVRAVLAAFPPERKATDAVLALALAETALADGQLDEAEAYIEHAQELAWGVPEQRRRRFELCLAHRRLWLACRRGDLDAVAEPMRVLDAALAARTPEELSRDKVLYATAWMYLGTAELWSLQLDVARDHLECALALARPLERPYLRIGCLGRLSVASVLSRPGPSAAIELADEALATGEAHGWAEHPVLETALTARGTAFLLLGCFEGAERSLERAQSVQRRDREPGLAFLLHYATGLLRFAQGRLDQAVAAFTAAQTTQRGSVSEHALSVELQSSLVQAHVARGDTAAAGAVLAGIAGPVRRRAVVRLAEATIGLAEGRYEDAVDVLAPALHAAGEPTLLAWPRIQALLCDAVARERLGDSRAAQGSLDQALELAGPERIVLPFVLAPARDLIERHADRRGREPAVLAAVLEALAGSCPSPCVRASLAEELSPAELRVLGHLPGELKADEIAAELYLSPNTVRTHLRHIYAKLDVHTRTNAVARARELGLLMRR